MFDALGDGATPLRWLRDGATHKHWRELWRGDWSLVSQHIDRHGRRYLVAVRTEGSSRKAPPLSTRERDVCARVAKGRSNKAIAYDLGISLSTVAGHIAKSMQKLGVRSRVALIVRWNILQPAVAE
jgi:DNA-binding NarL/FixJ family response regulator